MPGRKYVRVEKFGDWIRVRDTLRWYEQDALNDIQEIIEDEMDKAKEELVSKIESQSLGLAGLSEKWERYKNTHGLDPRVLIATGDYIDSFTVERKGKRTWQLYPKGNEQLAEWLEYGTSTMPPRPHWVFVKEELPIQIREQVQNLFRTKGGAR